MDEDVLQLGVLVFLHHGLLLRHVHVWHGRLRNEKARSANRGAGLAARGLPLLGVGGGGSGRRRRGARHTMCSAAWPALAMSSSSPPKLNDGSSAISISYPRRGKQKRRPAAADSAGWAGCAGAALAAHVRRTHGFT